MKRKPALTLSFLILAAALAAALWFWPVVYVSVIEPVARVFWLALRVFLMVDQEIYWIALIFGGVVLAALMIPIRHETYTGAYDHRLPTSDDRIAHWKGLFAAAQDPDGRLTLENRLQDLQASVFDLVDGDEQAEVTLPDLQANRLTARLARRGGPARFRLPWRKNRPADPAVLKSVEQVIASMENALEIKND